MMKKQPKNGVNDILNYVDPQNALKKIVCQDNDKIESDMDRNTDVTIINHVNYEHFKNLLHKPKNGKN
jgi:hypothetical protein